mmetsp:Transcript_12740/g.23883  ORF Transcript_12740/g.23883 Transcript_12740/m.23883 type:complete len:151 (+) Transcript_12740:144-596(+)
MLSAVKLQVALYLVLSSLLTNSVLGHSTSLRSNNRNLGYGYDDDNIENEYQYGEVASNSTGSSIIKDYTISHMQTTYGSVPAEWAADQWLFFAAMMFIFGTISSCFCLLMVLPCWCPSAMRTAYARYLASTIEEDFVLRNDSKKVRLIRK